MKPIPTIPKLKLR